ncbi:MULTISPECIES: FG-GAP-like repeat-containing protein [Streptomyces]|uniref:VCBS repeat-containing protein n=2 Tax=Streptomyces TaxID=1883 RepID=A0A100Y781_9ACTN|nr:MULTISPECIES: FG-GAP-like repeat-containing protein [Streptomyces]KUH38950.1 hypothetical protein ATE80_09660 [Streptomyces kanasensis]UUS31543.1 VCBS repeat-containing protein [Streptomyces changanensis]
MTFHRTYRTRSHARRLASCTALVLSAGLLLSGTAATAVADDGPRVPAQRPPVERSAPGVERPEGQFPKPRTRMSTESTAEAAAGAPSRHDFTGDGASDLLYRSVDGRFYLKRSEDPANDTDFGLFGDLDEKFKDVIPVGDLTGDGTADVLALSPYGTLWFRGTHTGGSGTSDPYWGGNGWQIYNKVLSLGDVSGDGTVDVLARTPAGELYLYRGNRSGSTPLQARVKVGTGWGAYDQLVGVNDATGDGLGDLYARTPAGDLLLYAGTGDAAAPFKAPVKVGTGWHIYNQLTSSDDITDDGRPDLFARDAAGTLYYYGTDATGRPTARQGFGTGWNTVDLIVGSGGNPSTGKASILGLDTRGTLWAYYSRHNGTLTTRDQVSDVGGWAGARVTFANSLDHDGEADLLEVYDGHLYNYDRYSDGPYDLGRGWDAYNTVVGPGDLSGDGKGDLLARTPAGALYLYRGDGRGYGLAPRLSLGTGWNAYNALVGGGDMTGDGHADLLARTPDGTLYLYAGTGTPGAPFKARAKVGTGWNAYTKLASPGDMTGDGRADILAVTSGGTLYRYTATHTGGPNPFATRANLGTGWNTYRTLH